MQESIQELIYAAISESDLKSLRKHTIELEHCLSMSDAYIQSWLDFFNDLLNEPKFLELGGALYIISILENISEKLSEKHKERYLQVFRLAHNKFDELEFDRIENLIFQEVVNKQSLPLSDLIKAIDLKIIFQTQHFSEEYFSLILELLAEPKFLNFEKSWHLLFLLETEWLSLSIEQKDRLILKLENIYGQSSNWMVDFVISELLGEFFADERAFEVLCRLEKLEDKDSRAFVPHGLEHIIKDSANKELAKKAYIMLVEMKNDISDRVRGEVEESLQRLAIRGINSY